MKPHNPATVRTSPFEAHWPPYCPWDCSKDSSAPVTSFALLMEVCVSSAKSCSYEASSIDSPSLGAPSGEDPARPTLFASAGGCCSGEGSNSSTGLIGGSTASTLSSTSISAGASLAKGVFAGGSNSPDLALSSVASIPKDTLDAGFAAPD